jgi:hypothetical protein
MEASKTVPAPDGGAARSLFAALPDHASIPMDSIEAALRSIEALGQVLGGTSTLDSDTTQELCELQSRLAGRALVELFGLAGNLMRGGA